MLVGMVASWKTQRTLRGCEEGGVVVKAHGGFLVRVQGGDIRKSHILIINFRLAIVALARCYFMSRTSGCSMHSIRGSPGPAHVNRWTIPSVREHILLRGLLRTGPINTCPDNYDSIYTSWLCYVVDLDAGVALVVQIKQLLRLGYD
jgi:hypothetical protein